MKELLKGGLINGDCHTVTGNTVSGNLASVPCVSDLKEQVGLSVMQSHTHINMDIIQILYT